MMKKLLTIIFLSVLFISCSSDDDENTQDYTSFTVEIDSSNKFENCIVAFREDNKFYKIAELGTLTKGIVSREIKLRDYKEEIYIFADFSKTIRFNDVYILKPNKNNNIIVKNGTGGITIDDTKDPTQYPQ